MTVVEEGCELVTAVSVMMDITGSSAKKCVKIGVKDMESVKKGSVCVKKDGKEVTVR